MRRIGDCPNGLDHDKGELAGHNYCYECVAHVQNMEAEQSAYSLLDAVRAENAAVQS